MLRERRIGARSLLGFYDPSPSPTRSEGQTRATLSSFALSATHRCEDETAIWLDRVAPPCTDTLGLEVQDRSSLEIIIARECAPRSVKCTKSVKYSPPVGIAEAAS